MKRMILLGAGLLPLASAREAELRLLNTTDLHGNVASYDYFQDAETERFGLERTASLIAAARRGGQRPALRQRRPLAGQPVRRL